jgi:hypothetical protein
MKGSIREELSRQRARPEEIPLAFACRNASTGLAARMSRRHLRSQH